MEAPDTAQSPKKQLDRQTSGRRSGHAPLLWVCRSPRKLLQDPEGGPGRAEGAECMAWLELDCRARRCSAAKPQRVSSLSSARRETLLNARLKLCPTLESESEAKPDMCMFLPHSLGNVHVKELPCRSWQPWMQLGKMGHQCQGLASKGKVIHLLAGFLLSLFGCVLRAC